MQRLAALLLTFLFTAGSAHTNDLYPILDPLAVPVSGDPEKAVIKVATPRHITRLRCDIVIAGGGLGGVAAALAGLRRGLYVCLTEETKWLGGQMTSEGVSALDENRWIETTGATATYQQLRDRIRAHYKRFLPPGKSDDLLNPGACWVSALCFEPAAGLEALNKIVAPYQASGKLKLALRTIAVAARKKDGKLSTLLTYSFTTRRFTELEGSVFIDATELGDLLALSGVPYRTGSESRKETGEPDAPETANSQDLQSFTYPFVLANDGAAVSVSKPPNYSRWQNQFSFTVLGLHNQPLQYGMFARLPGTPGSFWTYRRLIAHEQFLPGSFGSDLSMINWEANDVCDPGYLSNDPLKKAEALQHGKQVALGFAWWLQNEAPRDSGSGRGFSNLHLRADVLGTSDGLSQFPYIRESRRLIAPKIVREQDLAEPWQPGARAAAFDDSVGIGYYPIDIHGCGPRSRLPKSKPFQIPLGALLSPDVPNLIAGAKNLGTTHITNGAYRLHPTEWAVGEAAGTLASWTILHHEQPSQVYRNPRQLRTFQRHLLEAGQPLIWFDDIPLTHSHFLAAQLVSLEGFLPLDKNSLHFRPGDPITGAEAVAALRKVSSTARTPHSSDTALDALHSFSWDRLAPFHHGAENFKGTVLRGDFAQWLLNWR